MAEETNFFQLLEVIGREAARFPAGAPLVRKAVNEIVRAQLAAAQTGLDAVKGIRALLGASAFAEALDGVPPPKAKALLARVDPHAPAVTDVTERVKALLALADGSKAPAPAPERPAARRPAGKKAPPRGAIPPQPPEPPPENIAPPEAPPAPRRRATGRKALRVSEER